MSVLAGKGYRITVTETDLTCPICTFKFDASDKIEKSKDVVFKTRCPACKGKIGISLPIFGGTTKCFEWDVPKSVERLETIVPFTVNGREEIKKTFDDNSDEEDEQLV